MKKKYVYIIIGSFLFAIMLTVLIVSNKSKQESIITDSKEYWVSTDNVTDVDVEKGLYSYNEKTQLIRFENDNNCEVLIMNDNYTDSGKNMLKNVSYYDDNLKYVKPIGAWVSAKSNSCNYTDNDGNISLDYSINNKEYSLSANYNFINSDSLSIVWTNGAKSTKNDIYKKVKLKEFLNEYYMYLANNANKLIFEIKNIKVNPSVLTSSESISSDYRRISLNELVDYINNTYSTYMSVDDLITINGLFQQHLTYNNGKATYWYDAKYAQEFDIDIILSRNTNEHIKKSLQKGFCKNIKDIKVKEVKHTYYQLFVKLDYKDFDEYETIDCLDEIYNR